MKKGTKIWLIIALILILVGTGLSAAALSIGVNFADLRRNIVNGEYHLFGRRVFVEHEDHKVSIDDDDFDDISDGSFRADGVTRVPMTEEIEVLSVDMEFGNLVIKETPGDSQEIWMESKKPEDIRYFQWTVEDDKIIVKNKDEQLWTFGADMPEATLYIPANSEFSHISIDVDAGGCTVLTPLSCDELNVDVDAGGAAIKDIQTRWAGLECDAGSITLTGTVLDGGEANVDAGKIKMVLSGVEDTYYNYEIDVSAGALEINDHNFSGIEEKRYIRNKGEATWSLTCDAGKIEMKINK